MTEEILKIQLRELLDTIRLKRRNGTVLEASGIESARDCCADLRRGEIDSNSSDMLFQFLNLADQIAKESFPIQIEFAVISKKADAGTL